LREFPLSLPLIKPLKSKLPMFQLNLAQSQRKLRNQPRSLSRSQFQSQTPVETPILEPETEETAVFVTKPRRSSNALLLIFLIILFAALAAVIVVVINGLKSRQISTGYLSDDIGTSATVTEEEDVESLSCVYGATSDELLELTNNDLVTDSSYIFVANFDADELIEVLYTNQQTFNLEESAEAGADIARTEYQSALQALNISADPFKTTYVANDEVLTIKHYAAVNKLTAQNLQLIDLDVDDIDDYTSVDALTIEQLEDAYSDQEYTCTVHNYAAEM